MGFVYRHGIDRREDEKVVGLAIDGAFYSVLA